MYSKTEAVIQNSKYVLGTVLGQGIIDITYQATDIESGQQVLIKTLSDNLRQHAHFDQFKQKFLLRAKRFAQCQHPNLVRVLDSFEDAERPYLVMDYVPGQTLAEIRQENPSLSHSQAIHYIRQVGAALSILHQNGLLHRNVRPQTIIRCPGSHKVILSDFHINWGLAPNLIQSQISSLAAGYAPTEQYVPQTHDTPATDIYALSATLYFLLTGQPPVAASVRESLLRQSLSPDKGYASENALRDRRLLLDELRHCQSQINPAIAQAVLHGLEMVPEQRPQTVGAWLALLPQQARSQPTAAQSVHSSKVKETKPPGSSQPTPTLKVTHSVTKKKRAQSSIRTQKLGSQTLALLASFTSKQGRLWRSLMLTAAFAAAAGVGFGAAIRWNSPNEPGSTFLHTEQSFPPRQDWPVSDTPDLTVDPLPSDKPTR